MAGVGPFPEATAAVQEVQRVQEVEKVEKVEKAAITKVTSSTEIAKRKLKHILSSRALQIIKETMILEAQKKKEAQEDEAQEGGEKDKKITTYTTRSGRVVKPSPKDRENQQNTM